MSDKFIIETDNSRINADWLRVGKKKKRTLKHMQGKHNQKLHGNRGPRVGQELIKGLDAGVQSWYNDLPVKDQVAFRLRWYREMKKNPNADATNFAVQFEAERQRKIMVAGPPPAAAAAPKTVADVYGVPSGSVGSLGVWMQKMPQHLQDDFLLSYSVGSHATVYDAAADWAKSKVLTPQTSTAPAAAAPATPVAAAPATSVPAAATGPMNLAQAKSWYAGLSQIEKNRFRSAWFHEQRKNQNADYAQFASDYARKKAGQTAGTPAAPTAPKMSANRIAIIQSRKVQTLPQTEKFLDTLTPQQRQIFEAHWGGKIPTVQNPGYISSYVDSFIKFTEQFRSDNFGPAVAPAKAPKQQPAGKFQIVDISEAGVYMAMLEPNVLNAAIAKVSGHSVQTGLTFNHALVDYMNIHLQDNGSLATSMKKIPSTANLDSITMGTWYNKLDAKQKAAFDDAWYRQTGMNNRADFAKVWAKVYTQAQSVAKSQQPVSPQLATYTKGKVTNANFQSWFNNLPAHESTAFSATWTAHKVSNPTANITDFANNYLTQQKASARALAAATKRVQKLQAKPVKSFSQAEAFVNSLDATQRQDFFDNYWGAGNNPPTASSGKLLHRYFIQDAANYQRDLLAGKKGTTQVAISTAAPAVQTGWANGQYTKQVVAQKSDWTQWDADTTWEIVNGRPRSGNGSYEGDGSLVALLKSKGMMGAPHVVSNDTMDKMVSDGDQEIFRGISSPRSNGNEPDFVRGFMDGTANHAGFGVFGNGHYTSDSRAILSQYGSFGMRMTISKKARIIDFEDLYTAKSNLLREFHTTAGGTPYQRRAMEEVLKDNGRIAAYLGYDGYSVKDPTGPNYSNYGASGANKVGFWIMLNRTALAISEQYYDSSKSYSGVADPSAWVKMSFKEFVKAWRRRFRQLSMKSYKSD